MGSHGLLLVTALRMQIQEGVLWPMSLSPMVKTEAEDHVSDSIIAEYGYEPIKSNF